MPKLINLATFTDPRGNLTVVEKVLPFAIKRAFFIYGVDTSKRGGRRHMTTKQAAVCIKGSCRIYSNNGVHESYYHLGTPSKCLLIEPEDWHIMDQFTPDTILMVFASTYYTEDDYIFEPYPKKIHLAKQTVEF
ncbi:sugar 3,4-ketoisomerase [Flavitalea antarctica]